MHHMAFYLLYIEKDMDSYKAVVKFSKDANINAAYHLRN